MKTKTKWTLFWDMSSGGTQKEKWNLILIELPEASAVEYFERHFGHDPYDVACECCGQNYSVRDYETLEQAVDFHLNGRTLSEFLASGEVLVINTDEIAKQSTK